MKWLTSIITNRDLFPGKWGFAIFIAYMGLFINQGGFLFSGVFQGIVIIDHREFEEMPILTGLLVTASRQGRTTYPYNVTTVVLITEAVKLIISSAVFIRE